MMLDVVQIARAYGLPLIDYERPGQDGLLISIGSGLMMATMDHVEACRWCVDIPSSLVSTLDRALGAFERICDPILFVAWFSVTDPSPALVLKENHPLVHCYFRGLGSDTNNTWSDIVQFGK